MSTCWACMQKQWQSIIYAFWCISIVPQLDLYISHMNCMLCVCTQVKYISCRYSVLVCTFYIWATCLFCISLICILFILFWPMGILHICCIFYIFVWQWCIIYFMMHVCAHLMVPRSRILWIGNFPLPRFCMGCFNFLPSSMSLPPHVMKHHLPQRRRRKSQRLCVWHGILWGCGWPGLMSTPD